MANTDFALLSANAAIIGAIFIFFAVASQSSISSLWKYQNSYCTFGFNLNTEESQIAIITAGGILIVPFSLSSLFLLFNLRHQAIALTSIGFVMMIIAAMLTTFSLACRLPFDFVITIMVAPASVIIIALLTLFRYSNRLQGWFIYLNNSQERQG